VEKIVASEAKLRLVQLKVIELEMSSVEPGKTPITFIQVKQNVHSWPCNSHNHTKLKSNEPFCNLLHVWLYEFDVKIHHKAQEIGLSIK